MILRQTLAQAQYWIETCKMFCSPHEKGHGNHDDVIKCKHFPRYWPFVRAIHRSPVNSPHKCQWRGALVFSLVCVWINGWVNNREACDLRRHRAHYDVTLIIKWERDCLTRLDFLTNRQDPFVVKRNQLEESNNESVHTSSIVDFRETGPGSPLWPTGLTHAKLVSLTSPCCSDLGTARPSYLARVGPGLWPLSDWGRQGKIARHMQIFSNIFSCLENVVFFIQISLKCVPSNGLVLQKAIQAII